MDSVIVIKVISALLYPAGLIVLAVLFAYFLKWLNKLKLSRLSIVFAFLVFVLSSNTQVASWLVLSLEKQNPQLVLNELAVHDAIIVLGGGLKLPSKKVEYSQLTASSDRYWYAVRLYHAGKAKKIIVSGGNLIKQPGLKSEAYYARELLIEWGVPSSAIVLEQSSRTTNENKEGVAQLIKEHNFSSVLLVTSAMHMPRALDLFSSLPISITPAPADFVVRERAGVEGLAWLPSASAMNLTTRALHEYYGIWFNALKRAMN